MGIRALLGILPWGNNKTKNVTKVYGNTRLHPSTTCVPQALSCFPEIITDSRVLHCLSQKYSMPICVCICTFLFLKQFAIQYVHCSACSMFYLIYLYQYISVSVTGSLFQWLHNIQIWGISNLLNQIPHTPFVLVFFLIK